MFTTLPESRAAHQRNTRSTAVSVLVHGAFIALAVALSMPRLVDATEKPLEQKVEFVPVPDPPLRPTAPQMRAPAVPAPSTQVLPTIAAPDITPTELPPVDLAPAMPPDHIVIGAPGSRVGTPGASTLLGSPSNGVADVSIVERIPSVLGAAPVPLYPPALRASGIAGQVVVRFVVDTLGRVEMDGVSVVDATHQLFADAVRNALARFRFLPGEIGGRKVRTMVQVPFTFTLR